MNDIKSLLDQINLQYRYLLNTRSVFPYLDDSAVGRNIFRTAAFYRIEGFDVHFSFNRPLTETDVDRIRSVGHWINENYLIRLCALLEYYDIIPKSENEKIDKDLNGSDELDILRRLRNKFVHKSGKYNSNNPKERKLYERIVKHFGVVLAKDPSTAKQYPISIDLVIKPITEKCKEYIIELKNKKDT